MCSICFEGINKLAYSYIINNNLQFLGIVFTDFFGDDILKKGVSLNTGKFVKCPQVQLDHGCTYCSSTSNCLGCNETLFYIYNPVTFNCDAAVGYFINATFIPELCSIPMIGCLDCSSDTVCTVCDVFGNYKLINGSCEAATGYFLDATRVPIKCTMIGCS